MKLSLNIKGTNNKTIIQIAINNPSKEIKINFLEKFLVRLTFNFKSSEDLLKSMRFVLLRNLSNIKMRTVVNKPMKIESAVMT